MANVFSVQIFFVVFRESLEAIVVVSVLLAFIKQGLGGSDQDPVVYKKLRNQIWIGSILGVVVCLIIGCAFIGVFYALGKNIWSKSEDLWEGVFCIIAALMISVMGIAMLRINKMKEKWRIKLADALLRDTTNSKDRFKIGHLTKKYCMFVLPFITCLREGLEAVVFVGGVGLKTPATAFPLPVICGLIAGIFVGWLLYYFGSTSSLQVFLVASTCVLYLISAGLFSRGIWGFEMYQYSKLSGGDAAEKGSGAGSYDVSKSVWHVNCCNPEKDHGWDVFNSLLGWENSATYGSVISYNLYWLAMIATLMLMLYDEQRGHLPFCKNLQMRHLNPMYYIKGEKTLTKKEQTELLERVKKHHFGVEGLLNDTQSDDIEKAHAEKKIDGQEIVEVKDT